VSDAPASRPAWYDFSLDERRRFEWYMRFGAGATLREIGDMVGVSSEIVRVDLNIVERRCATHWKKLIGSSPVARRLRAVNALVPVHMFGDFADGCFARWSWLPKIPPMQPARRKKKARCPS